LASTATLSFAVRPRVLARLTGRVALLLTGINAPLVLVSLIDQEWAGAGAHAAVLAVLVGLWVVLSRGKAAAVPQTNEAMVLSALAFGLGSAALALPWWAEGVPFIDALFEGVSAVTTTGLSTLDSVENKPWSFLFARAWGQWSGGLMIVLLALFLTLERGAVAGRWLSYQLTAEEVMLGSRAWMRTMAMVYSGITVVTIVAFLAVGLDPWNALLHGLTTVCGGGFAADDASIGGIGGRGVQAVAMIGGVFGAVSFLIWPQLRKGRWREVLGAPELRAFATLCIAGSIVLFGTMTLLSGLPWRETLWDAFLMSLSCQTTTGFSTLDLGPLDPVSKVVMTVQMLLGGDTASAAGGIKMFRLIAMLRLAQGAIARTALAPHAVIPTRAGEADLIRGTATVVTLFALMLLLSWSTFLGAGIDPVDALYDCASALSICGASVGVASHGLAWPLKLVLTVVMLVGRLEIVAVLVLFYPRTWIGRRQDEGR
jgi:trk system potassium uptake protein TrkH